MKSLGVEKRGKGRKKWGRKEEKETEGMERRREGEQMGRREGGRKEERQEGMEEKTGEEGIEGRGFEGRRKINIRDYLIAYRRITPKCNNLINSQFYKLKKNRRYYIDTLNIKVFQCLEPTVISIRILDSKTEGCSSNERDVISKSDHLNPKTMMVYLLC